MTNSFKQFIKQAFSKIEARARPSVPAQKGNPFDYARPVSPSHFAGRKGVIAKIYDGVLSKEAKDCLVLGSPKIGKSSLVGYLCDKESLMDHCQSRSLKPEGVTIFVMEKQDYGNPYEFWRRFVTKLVSATRQADIGKFGLLVNARRKLWSKETPPDSADMKQVGEVLKRIGITVVIIFDDFDELAKKKDFDAGFFDALLNLREYSEGTVRFVAFADTDPSEIFRTRRDLGQVRSDFLDRFDSIDLVPFSPEEVRELVVRGQPTLTPEDAATIVKKTGGHPFLVQAFCFHAFNGKTQDKSWEEIIGEVQKDSAVVAFINTLRESLSSPEVRVIRDAVRLGREGRLQPSYEGTDTMEVLDTLARKAVLQQVDRCGEAEVICYTYGGKPCIPGSLILWESLKKLPSIPPTRFEYLRIIISIGAAIAAIICNLPSLFGLLWATIIGIVFLVIYTPLCIWEIYREKINLVALFRKRKWAVISLLAGVFVGAYLLYPIAQFMPLLLAFASIVLVDGVLYLNMRRGLEYAIGTSALALMALTLATILGLFLNSVLWLLFFGILAFLASISLTLVAKG